MDAVEHNEALLDELNAGDRIRFERGGLYEHWGLYTGDGKVVHKTGESRDIMPSRSVAPSSASGQVKEKMSIVREDDLLTVAGNHRAHKDNSMDEKYSPFSPDEIVKKAKDSIGESGYNIVNRNCEHFVNDSRYGRSESGQSDGALAILLILGGAAVVCVSGYLFYKFVTSGKEKEKKQKQ